jgi:hypothetical protein
MKRGMSRIVLVEHRDDIKIWALEKYPSSHGSFSFKIFSRNEK